MKDFELAKSKWLYIHSYSKLSDVVGLLLESSKSRIFFPVLESE